MAALITLKGPNVGRRFPLADRCSIIGRQPEVPVHLESLAVSRNHARHRRRGGGFYVEDTGSSNGTFVNGHRIAGRVPFAEGDTLQIGPYELELHVEKPEPVTEPAQIVRARIDAHPSNASLFLQNPTRKLQVMLQIAQDLGQTLDIDPLLGKLLDHLLGLFPQADRGMVLLCEEDRLAVRAQRTRRLGEAGDFPYSRTIVRRALDEGVGLLSEDVRGDRNLVLSATLARSTCDRSSACRCSAGRIDGWACCNSTACARARRSTRKTWNCWRPSRCRPASSCKMRPTTPSASARSGCARKS